MKTLAKQLVIVDSLTIDVITDDVSDPYVSKCCGALSEFDNIVKAGAHEISGKTLLLANLGYGLRLTISVNNTKEHVLFDIGPDGKTFVRNCNDLGLNLSNISDVIMTHGHWDHMGGLLDALKKIHRDGGHPNVHVNQGMFVERGVCLKDGNIIPLQNVPSIHQIQLHGALVVNDVNPRLISNNTIYYSGEIPRITSFEMGRSDHFCKPHQHADWEPDPFLMDERMIVVHVKNLGLCVFSACSHAGIVNVCLLVQKIFPNIPIYLVMGGLHLGGVMEKIIPETVESIRQFNVQNFVLGHCTGWRALVAFADAFGDKVSESAVGTTYTFSYSNPG